LALFDAVLGSGLSSVLALRLDAGVLRSQARSGGLVPLLSGLVPTPADRDSAASFAAKLADLTSIEREGTVLDLVRAEVAAVLGKSSGEAIPPTRAFKDLGIESLALVELCKRLSVVTGLRVSTTHVFDHPTAAELAESLLERAQDHTRPGVRAELGRLESMLAAIPADDPGRAQLAAQLRALAADLEGSRPAEPDDGLAASRLAAASDDELFDFIDKQVGPVDAVTAGSEKEPRDGR
jgi:mycoketide-CoA synthase